MKRYVLDADSNVVNAIELEDDAVWTVPEGLTLAAKDYVPAPLPQPAEPETEPDFKDAYARATSPAIKLDVLAKALGLKD